MKFISLFAGVGGFDLALERLGHECVYANDIDKYCKIIYDRHFKTKLDCRSITGATTDEIPDHELLCGGFPCQSFSIAGKRRGFADIRGTMFFEIARIVSAKKPRLFMLENVRGLLSHDGGNTFKVIITTLDELGYDLQWQVLNSKNFGVPQNRERVFIIGHLRGTSRPEVFPIRKSDGISEESEREKQTENFYSTAITTNYRKGVHSGGETYAIGTLRTYKDGRGFREMKSGMSPTIPSRAREDGSGQPIIYDMKAIGSKTRRGFKKEGYVGALDTSSLQAVNGLRRLTPIECERLQGFPDNWTEGVSDTQRYKMMGNAVTVNVVYEIVKRLQM